MIEMHDIYFLPNDVRAKAEKGTTLMAAAANRGVAIRSDCGGRGTCGKCRVTVDDPGALDAAEGTETKLLSASGASSNDRLACLAAISGAVTVTLPDDPAKGHEPDGKTGVKGDFSVNPAVKRLVLPPGSVTLANLDNSLSIDELLKAVVHKVHGEPIRFDSKLPATGIALDAIRGKGATVVHHHTLGVIKVLEGVREKRLGFAFDIGTTTVAAYLCDLGTGEVLASRAKVNPQRRYGEDVISRIAAVGEDLGALGKQRKLVADAMGELMTLCLGEAGFDPSDIDELTVVGNTTMEHLLAGFDPRSLGLSPYLPVTRSSVTARAGALGLNLEDEIPVYIFPVVSAFLGGDILSALLADRSHPREETTLIIDVGTNGELILSDKEKIWATSCATGPALEGAQISCGMRASEGAVSRVFVDRDVESGFAYETIGDAPAVGICGSGIIDALAVMRKLGITLENGNFDALKPGVILNEKGTGRGFNLPGSDLAITLKDVRQVQLAKAALFVGIRSLLDKAGVKRVDRTILTGAFGARFNWENARDIGMLPPEVCEGEILSERNLAGAGAVAALLDRKKRGEIEAIAGEVRFLDLSLEPDFTMNFSNATRFPSLG